MGRGIVVWLLLTVWFTDILGYVVGNVLAGPKLAPSISPRKTWSGFFWRADRSNVGGRACPQFSDAP